MFHIQRPIRIISLGSLFLELFYFYYLVRDCKPLTCQGRLVFIRRCSDLFGPMFLSFEVLAMDGECLFTNG